MYLPVVSRWVEEGVDPRGVLGVPRGGSRMSRYLDTISTEAKYTMASARN